MVVQPPNFAAYANPNFGLALGDRIGDLPEAYMKGREMSRSRQMQDMFSGGLPEKNGVVDWSAALQKYIKEGARIGGGQFMGGMMAPMLSEENARTAAALARGEQPPPSAIFGQSSIGLANSPAAQPAQTPQDQAPQPTFGQVAASYRLPPASIDSLGRVLKIDPAMKLTPQQVKAARFAIEEALPNRRTADSGVAAPEETSTGATSAVEQNNNGPGGENAAALPASGVSGGPGASAASVGEGTPPPFARPGEASISQPQTANQRVAGGFEQAGWRQTPVGTEAEAQRLIRGAINREAAAAYMEAKSKGSGKALLEQATADRKRASEIRASLGEYNKPTTEMQNAEASGLKGGPAAFERAKAWAKVEAENGALTLDQKNARAEGMTPLEYERAKVEGKVRAENKALTTGQKNAPPGMSVQEAAAHEKQLAAVGEAKGKRVADAIGGIKPAREALNVINEMDNALTSGWNNISTGAGARQWLEVKKAVNNVYPGTFSNVSQSETIDKLNAQLAAAAAKAMTARPSQLEFRAFMSNNPGLLTSRETSRNLLDIMRQGKQQELELGQIASKLRPGEDYADAEDRYYRSHPIISPFTHKPIDAKQAPDGKWYRPDPDRPGKYIMER